MLVDQLDGVSSFPPLSPSTKERHVNETVSRGYAYNLSVYVIQELFGVSPLGGMGKIDDFL